MVDLKRLISLVLVLALVFSILALPAQAATLGTGLLIGVAATSVVASALIGLGVLPGSDGSVFDGIVNDAVAHLQSLGFGDGTTIPVLKYLGTAGNVMYALQTAALSTLRSWLWDTDIFSSIDGITDLSGLTFDSWTTSSTSSKPCIPFFYSYSYPNSAVAGGYSHTTFLGAWSSQHFYITSGSSYNYSYAAFAGGEICRLQTFSSVWSPLPSYSGFCNLGHYDGLSLDDCQSWVSSLPVPTLSFSELSFGDVAPEDEEISVAYPSWGYGSVEIPASGDDEDPDPFIPVTLLPTYDETKGLTQDQAQSGDSSLETPNSGTSVDVSGDVGGSITPDGGGGDLPEGESYPTVSDLTTMFAWLASSIDRSVELLFPDLQVIKTYLKALAQWEENKDVQLTSILSYLSGFDTDIDTMLTNLSNIDVNVTSMLTHAENSVSILTGIASDVKDIRDVIADPLDADINESQQDNKTAFLDNFANKSQADNIGDLGGLSGGMTDWFKLDNVDITSMFDQVDTGFGRWFTSETAQSISVGGGAAAAGIGVGLMDDAEYVEPETPYLDAYTQEVQDILAGGDGEW